MAQIKRKALKEEYIMHDEFLASCEKIIGKKHDDKGIGTLAEKTVHGVLKNFFEPDEDNQEVALNGYFADIYNGNGVIEIQTAGFNKWVSWIDTKTGEAGAKRMSPRHFSEYDAFFELYKIKSYLLNPNLRIKLVLMDMEEYKLLNGWNSTKKKGAQRYDRIPVGIRKIIDIEQPEDYI